jgi:hypothetical protein
MEFTGFSTTQRPQNNGLDNRFVVPELGVIAPLQPSGSTSAIVFIDPGVADYQQLLPSLSQNSAVYLLDPARNAIDQITQTLLGRSGINSLKIISHGQSGAVQLGADWLSFENLDRHSTQIQSWSQAMTENADILLYGCYVAQGLRGEAFLYALSQLTQADVAASNDLTGSAALGGDWDLEFQTGAIEAAADRTLSYQGLLAPDLVSQASSVSDSAGGKLSTSLQGGLLTTNQQTVSADGRFVVFTSTAGNLTEKDDNGIEDVFLLDRNTNTIRLISAIVADGTSGNAASTDPVISADGRYVAFLSRATNLVADTSNETDGSQNVYFVDTQAPAGTVAIQRVSRPGGFPGRNRGDSNAVTMSADGRYVAFVSAATDLTFLSDANQEVDVFAWDRDATAGAQVIAVSGAGVQMGNGRSFAPAISGPTTDGKYFVAFVSGASNLVAGDTALQDVFLYSLTDFQVVERISQANATTAANSQSSAPVISRDGSRVAFVSSAANLVSGDNNNAADVFVWTRGAATPIQLVSANDAGAVANSAAANPVISADGKFIAFESQATNLTNIPTGDRRQVYLRDVDAQKTVLVSQNNSGQADDGNDPTKRPTIANVTANGTTQVYVGFVSSGTNLITGDTNGAADAFLRSIPSAAAIDTGNTSLISRTTTGTVGNGAADSIVISGNGQTVVFGTTAGNLAAEQDTNGITDIFTVPSATGNPTLASKRLATLPANAANNTSTLNSKNSISDNGQFAVFSSTANNLVAGDNNGVRDVFRRNITTGENTLLSSLNGVLGNQDSLNPIVSGNGQFVAFESTATNLGNGSGQRHILVWDGSGTTPTLRLISQGLNNAPANGDSTVKAVSNDGRYVVFSSTATNLVATDSNNFEDLFLWDRTSNSIRNITAIGNQTSNGEVVISADNRFILFASRAANLVTGVTDTNELDDIFLFEIATGTLSVVSAVGNATSNGNSFAPTISDNGQVIGFASTATNLISGVTDNNNGADVFARRSPTSALELISANPAGTATGGVTGGNAFGVLGSSKPVVSGDGRFITFASNANDLTSGDANGNDLDIFTRDLTANATLLISAKPDGQTSPGNSDNPVMSGDGRFVMFTSTATGLDPRDTNGAVQDVFLWDRSRATNPVRLLSLNKTDNGSGNQISRNPAISRDGSYTLFETDATNIITGDFNAAADVVGGSVRPTLSLTVLDGTAIEVDSPTDLGVYQLSRTEATEAIAVVLTLDTTVVGAATAADFTLSASDGTNPIAITSNTPGTYELSMAAGVATVQLTVTPVDDTIAEALEAVPLRLTPNPLYSVRNAANSVNISDQDTTVINTNDAGEGSLRQAILNANASPGANSIEFQIPGTGAELRTINLQTALPTITETVILNGAAQPGVVDQPLIVLNGAGITTGTPNGLTIQADNVQVRGLVVQGFRGNGIAVAGNNNKIGDQVLDAARNRIANNALDGVVITSGTGNLISGNSISGNAGLGINLGTDQITANDAGDADTGANDLQNFPVITIAEPTTNGAKFRGSLAAKPSTTYKVELFNTPTGTAAEAEGQTFLERRDLTTDEAGNVTFDVEWFVPLTGYITATATDPQGNTSEFSAPRLIEVPQVSIAPIAPANKPEGNASATTPFGFRISLTQPSTSDITVNYRTQDGTATVANQDYTAVPNGVATIRSGETFVDVTVNATGDDVFEPNETFAVELVSATGATIDTTKTSATATIDNDDLQPNPTVTIAPAVEFVTEAATTYSFNVTLSRLPDADRPVTLRYRTLDGTARAGANGDYTAVTDGTVQFSSTDPLTKTITVNILDDAVREPDETFQVELLDTSTNVNLGTQKIANGVIRDNNDPAPTIAIAPPELRRPEGNTGDTDFAFTVSLSGASGEVVKVNYATVDGTAIKGEDYTEATGTLTFNPGEPLTQTVTVKVKGDTTIEPSETFKLVLSNPDKATLDATRTEATGRIIGDDPFLQPIVTLVPPTTTSVAEGNPGAGQNPKLKFTVKLDRPAPEPLQVTYQTVNGTALNTDRDYSGQIGILNFAAGEEQKDIEIEIISDTQVEAAETFSLELTGATGGTIETPQTQTITILNDDQPPPPTLRLLPVLPNALTERTSVDQPFQFIVELLNAPANQAVTVEYETVAGTATADVDYVATTGTLTFAADDRANKIVTIAGKDDTTLETGDPETFSLRLKNPTAGAVLDPAQTAITVQIIDDEVPPPPPPIPVPPPPPPVPVPPPPAPIPVPPPPAPIPVPPPPAPIPVPPPGPVPPPPPPVPPGIGLPTGLVAGLDGDVDLFWRNLRTGTNVTWRTDRSPAFIRDDLPRLTEAGLRVEGAIDFDADGDVDLLLRNGITGANQIWLLQNSQVAGVVPLPTLVDTGWKFEQTADLTGDGWNDILLRNDRTGDTAIWVMSGTTVVRALGLPNVDLGWKIQATADFNGDNKRDILWRNELTGENGLWLLDNGNYVSNVFLPKVLIGQGWSIADVADFNNDRSQDILWFNSASGEAHLWTMSGVNYVAGSTIGFVPIENWSIQAARDFNGDGYVDIIWRNNTSGDNAVWYLQGGTFGIGVFLPGVAPAFRLVEVVDVNRDGALDYVWSNPGTGETFLWRGQFGGNFGTATNLPTVANPAWSVKTTGDFNRDGTKDLLWYNQQTGETTVWVMRQGAFVAQGSTPVVPDLAWTVGGSGDFDRDGDADVLWYNPRTGQTGFWEMQDGNFVRAIVGTTPNLPDGSWIVAGIADYDRDGISDILWRNTRTGANGIWRLQGFNYDRVFDLPTVDLKWDLLRTADFNGDRSPDLLWRNRESGEVLIWRMSGPTYVPSDVNYLPAVTNPQWIVQGAGDFNRDGFQDILWYNTGTGSIALWYINNARFGAAVYLPTVADVDWKIQGVDNFGTP